jgi:hypothetical protein
MVDLSGLERVFFFVDKEGLGVVAVGEIEVIL